MTQTPNGDSIIDGIHQTRRKIAHQFGGDIAAILDDARKRQAASGRPVWRQKSSEASLQSSGDTPAADSEATP